MKAPPTPESLALDLERIAGLLHAQAAAPRLVASFRRAAATVAAVSPSLLAGRDAHLVHGMDDLVAACTLQLVQWGSCPLLIRLEGRLTLEEQLVAIPSIGRTLARRVAGALDIETLEEAIVAAETGRLGRISGVGPLRGQRIAQQGRLLLDPLRRGGTTGGEGPSADLVLAFDREYRRLALGSGLPALVPTRHNPAHAANMPVFHTELEGWNAMVHFSNRSPSGGDDSSKNDRVIVYLQRGGVEIQRVVFSAAAAASGPCRVQRLVARNAAAAAAGTTVAA